MNMAPKPRPAIDRVLERITFDDSGCWLYTGALDRGYGVVGIRIGRGVYAREYAHRVSYVHHVGPIPEGLHLDHLCRVRNCVNPKHLDPVAPGINIQRGDTGVANAVKSECPAGHPYDLANTYIAANGSRQCRRCRRERVNAKNADACRKGHPRTPENRVMKGKVDSCRICVDEFEARRSKRT